TSAGGDFRQHSLEDGSFQTEHWSKRLSAISLSRDGQLGAAIDRGETVHIWDISSGRLIASWDPGHAEGTTSMAFSPDKRYLATGGVHGRERLWSLPSRKLLWEGKLSKRPIGALAFSPDGRLLVSVETPREIIIQEVATGKVVGNFSHPFGFLFANYNCLG